MARFFGFVKSNYLEILSQTIEHVYLTLISLFIAIILGLTIGIFLSRSRNAARTVLGILGVIQTIPSLALLGLLIPLIGIGAAPAIVALFLYALLPIVRNTYTGIIEVEHSIIEAAQGMGMNNRQILLKVELPLSVPIIFAGIRTAVVINVGVATLCALIAAGGLGEFIFRGIALNDPVVMLSGAIPAALLALVFDFGLGFLQKIINQAGKYIAIGAATLILFTIVYGIASSFSSKKLLGSNPEFIVRADGYKGLQKLYNFSNIKTVDMEEGLMYQSLAEKKLDAIIGYSTDGRIASNNLKVLKDDKKYFPPYYVAPLVRRTTIENYPQLIPIFDQIAGKISEEEMTRLNYLVDGEKLKPRKVVEHFMRKKGFKIGRYYTGSSPNIKVGGKKFTEHFILAELFKILIENNSNLNVELKTGLGGTQIAFEALKRGEIDLYPEYTGTALLVQLRTSPRQVKLLENDRKKVYDYVKTQMKKRFALEWLQPLGFDNTYAVVMRKKQAEQLGIKTISDFSKYLQQGK